MMCGCREKAPNPNKDIGMAAFSDWKTEGYAINSRKIRDVINKLCRADRDSLVADQYTRKYYLNSNAFVWIDRSGVDSRADTLLAALRSVGDMGFGERAFCVAAIERAVGRVRGLDFEDGSPSINETLAYVEYNLTKAYLRYAVGQRFGFTNPSRLFNRLDELPRDSTERFKGFRRLFDVDVERPDQRFYAAAFEAVHADTIGPFLRGVEPRGAMYGRLVFMLPLTRSQQARRRLLCNIERCRWRERGGVRAEDQRRVVVNIPAFHLYAYGPDTVVDMRVGCGSTATKTPLLNSAIERMDVNPVWNIPMSIIKKDIAHHAGDAHYFDSRRYYVVDKNTGERLPVETVTRAMLMGGGCRVVQEGGEGNALGHIIFRFPNNFSVFLHDTSSRGVFGDRKSVV